LIFFGYWAIIPNNEEFDSNGKYPSSPKAYLNFKPLKAPLIPAFLIPGAVVHSSVVKHQPEAPIGVYFSQRPQLSSMTQSSTFGFAL
jgi:hypothetical protein